MKSMNTSPQRAVPRRPHARAGGHEVRRHGIALALILLSGSAAGGADAPDGPFDLTLRAGGFDERCLRIEAGGRIEYAFAAAAPVEFNIHYHRGKDVFYPVRRPATRGGDTQRFRAESADDYCLMWENRGSAPVRVTGRLQRLR